MFKLALNAGHYSGTTKGIPATLSPTGKHIDEWTLNDRVCDRIEALLAGFDGVEILRLDDTTGKTDVPLEARTDAANAWGADFYLSIHHNAGIGGGSGGGMVAYVYTHVGDETLAWQKDLYDALIAATGLRGNRSQPLAKADLHEVRETNMSAVLLELGFMDSTTNVPVILSDDFADKCAAAIVDVIARRAGLTKKPESTPGKMYRLFANGEQKGAFRISENVLNMAKEYIENGNDVEITVRDN